MTLSLHNLSFGFDGNPLFANVSLAFADAGIVGLTGANGSGKSTLLNLIAGECRGTGEIRLFGRDASEWGSGRRARAGLGYVYQHPEVVSGFGWNDHILFAAGGRSRPAAGQSPAYIEEVIGELARSSGVDDLETAPAELYSFGQQKLLNIACVLRRRPRLILLDEPFAGLAGAVVPVVLEVIAEVGKSATIILVDHDHDRIKSLAQSQFRVVPPSVEVQR